MPEGVEGQGWETLRKSLSLVSECYFLFVNRTEKAEIVTMNKVGMGWCSDNHSYAKVVKEESLRK